MQLDQWSAKHQSNRALIITVYIHSLFSGEPQRLKELVAQQQHSSQKPKVKHNQRWSQQKDG